MAPPAAEATAMEIDGGGAPAPVSSTGGGEASSPAPRQQPENDPTLPPSLQIPITSLPGGGDFVEIFPEEISDIPSAALAKVLTDEDAPLSTWSDAALLYVQNRAAVSGSDLLREACRREEAGASGANNEDRVRTLASAGIALLTQVNRGGALGGGGAGGGAGDLADGGAGAAAAAEDLEQRDENFRQLSDKQFNRATKIDGLFPMTWIGRGMLHLTAGRTDQAQFFFETTLKQCGQVLPALLGMAAVRFKKEDYAGAQEMYGRAMALFPDKSGSETRVGFGLACYRLGQVSLFVFVVCLCCWDRAQEKHVACM
jgi:tetratricopeptide (TPR) repeat protein